MILLLGLLTAFAFLATHWRNERVNVHLMTLTLILIDVAYQAVTYHLR